MRKLFIPICAQHTRVYLGPSQHTRSINAYFLIISARVFRQFYETGLDTQRLFPRSMDGWARDAISFDSFVVVASNTGSSSPLHFVLSRLHLIFFMNNLILLLLILIVNIYKTLVNVWFFRYSYFRVKWSYINDDYVEMKRRRANWRINKAYLTSFRL